MEGAGVGDGGAGKADVAQSKPESPPGQLVLHSDQVLPRAKQRAPASLQHCDSRQFSPLEAQFEPEARFDGSRISSNFEQAHLLS